MLTSGMLMSKYSKILELIGHVLLVVPMSRGT